jgi:Condensation domain/TubC N-terminal docking domain
LNFIEAMFSAGRQESRKDIPGIVAALYAKGVKLWSENGKLRYKARKGALTDDELAYLRAEREQIVGFLERVGRGTSEFKLQRRESGHLAPLTYAQMAYWDSGRRTRRAPIRQIASATRLRGRLRTSLLCESFAEILRRHEALRTRIVLIDGVPMQDIAQTLPCDLRVVDLTAELPTVREQEVGRLLRALILEPFRLDTGPLFAVQLARLRDDEHVLMLALEHMISDAYSLNLLLRDLLAIYAQALSRTAPALRPVCVQLADYAVWQSNVEESWSKDHADYWRQLLEAPAFRLQAPRDAAISGGAGWGVVSSRITRELKLELRNWCRVRATTFAMGLLTAYAALVLRSCGACGGVFRCVTDGRTQPEIQDTIGCFAAPMYLRLRLDEHESFLDLLSHLTEEYCEAYRHADFHYLQVRASRCEPMRTTIFNWIPREPKFDTSVLEGTPDALVCSDVRFFNPLYDGFTMDADPIVLLHDTDDEIQIELLFPRDQFTASVMQTFIDDFLAVIEALLNRPEQKIGDIVLRWISQKPHERSLTAIP